MQHESTVSKWGNSLAIRIPKAIARQSSLNEGDGVTFALDSEGCIVLRPSRRKYELTEMVAGITRKNRHSLTEWGLPQGNESW